MDGSKLDLETLGTLEDAGQEEMGQEATLVENSPKSKLGSVFLKLRRKKSKQTNIILPPQINLALAAALSDEHRQEANHKADYARRLLEAAFRPDEAGWNKKDPAEFRGMKKEDMIQTAFKYAVEARRLSSSTPLKREWEDALEEHRVEGETSALEARRFIKAFKSRALLTNLDMGEEDDGSINGGLFTPKDIQDAAEKNIDVARYHMEYILSTFEKKLKAPEHIILNASPEKGSEDFTLSTLGFDNTFGMLSITSLNEIMDGTLSKVSRLGEQTSDEQPVSPLSGTILSEVDISKKGCSSLSRRQQKTPKTKPGTILLPPSQKSNEARAKETSEDASEISEISADLESLREFETAINVKLKKAAAEGDGEFSLVGEEAHIVPPKMVSVPSFDPSIVFENWDSLIEGGSLDDLLMKSIQARDPVENKSQYQKQEKKGIMMWRRRKDPGNSKNEDGKMQKKRSTVLDPIDSRSPPLDDRNDPGAIKNEGTKMQKKRPTASVPIESRAPPSLTSSPVEEMKFVSLDAAEDPLEPSRDHSPIKRIAVPSKALASSEQEGASAPLVDEPTVIKQRMMSWRKRKRNTKGCVASKQTETQGDNNKKLLTDVPKGVTSSTDDIDVGSLSEDFGDKLKISVEANTSPESANRKIVRRVLSADGGDAVGEVANKVDFAQVEIGEDNAVRTEKTLVSRDAVIRNIYAERKPVITPRRMERSNTMNGATTYDVEPSSSFLEMIGKEKSEAVRKREEEARSGEVEKRRFSGLFGRKRQKIRPPQTVYLQPPDLQQGT